MIQNDWAPNLVSRLPWCRQKRAFPIPRIGAKEDAQIAIPPGSMRHLLKRLHSPLAEQLLGAFDEASVGAYG